MQLGRFFDLTIGLLIMSAGFTWHQEQPATAIFWVEIVLESGLGPSDQAWTVFHNMHSGLRDFIKPNGRLSASFAPTAYVQQVHNLELAEVMR